MTQLRLDAALYEPAPPSKPGTIGRPRKKGKRLPTLSQVLTNKQTDWERVRVDNWYGQGSTQVEIASDTAVWYHTGMPALPIRWVFPAPAPQAQVIRDPNGQFETKALLCTDQSTDPTQILRWFVCRWQVEVTFQEVRTHLGVETQHQWSEKAIARTTPILMGLFSWVTLLINQSHVDGNFPIRQAAWYAKTTSTFSDAIALVRRRIWEHWGFCMSSFIPDIQKSHTNLLKRLFETVCYST